MITHRCKELLEYNKKAHIPVAIRYEKWFKNFNINGDYSSWILSNLEWNNEDWDIKYMTNCCRIEYCPFCGEKLENESE